MDWPVRLRARYGRRCDVWTRGQHAVALLACLLTLAGIWWAPRSLVQWPDSRDYLKLARSLSEGRGFSLPHLPHMQGRMPAYPALLAWTGYLRTNPPGRERAPWWQALLVGATVFSVGVIGALLGGSRVGFAAAALVSLYVPLYANGIAVLTDCLATATFTAGLALTVTLLCGKGGWPAAVAAGACFGLGALTKATLIGYPLIVAPLLIVYAMRCERRLLVPIFAAGVLFALPVLGWSYRNYTVSGCFSPASTDGAVNLWWGSRPDRMEIVRRGTGYGHHLPEFAALCGGESYYRPDVARRFSAAAWDNIRREPWGVVGRGLYNVAYVWVTPITLRLLPNAPLNVALIVVRLAVWGLAIYGLAAAWRGGARYPALALALVFIYVTTVFTFYLAMHRLFMPFMPALFPLAAVGLLRLLESGTRRGS